VLGVTNGGWSDAPQRIYCTTHAHPLHHPPVQVELPACPLEDPVGQAMQALPSSSA
jgi:hypothetical protein